MEWLSPSDIQKKFRISRAQTYKLIKGYVEANRPYIAIGRLKRYPEEQFTEYLRGNHEKRS